MDDIELDNLDKDRPEDRENDREEEQTPFDDDWRNESIVVIDTSNPDAIPNPRKDAGAIRRAYTEDKKSLPRKMNININKGDGPAAKLVLEKLKVTVNRKGRVNGAEYDGIRIIVQKGKRLPYTEDAKKVSKVNEFKDIVRRAEAEHKNTAVALVEEKLDVSVNDDLANSVLRDSFERLDEEISERANEIRIELSENELREFRGILAAKSDKFLKIEEHWRDLAKKQPNARKDKLYEAIADVAALKAGEIRLRTNRRPEGQLARSVVEEEAKGNDLTRFERFKKWAKRNLGGISIVAISVAGIITTIVMGTRNAVKGGARATSKFAQTLRKFAEKAAPVVGALLNLAAKVLTLGAKAIGCLSEHLWILAVTIAYILYKERHSNK